MSMDSDMFDVDPLGESIDLPKSWDQMAAILGQTQKPLRATASSHLPADWALIPGEGVCAPNLVVDIAADADLELVFADVAAYLDQCQPGVVVFHMRGCYGPFMKKYDEVWRADFRHRTGIKIAVRLCRGWNPLNISGIDAGGLPSGYPWGPVPHVLTGAGIEKIKLRVWLLDDLLSSEADGQRFITQHTGQPPSRVPGPYWNGSDISFGALGPKRVERWAARIYLDPDESLHLGFPARLLLPTRPAGSTVVWGKPRRANAETTSWRPASLGSFLLRPRDWVKI